jgi:hypothetical protein
MYLKSLLHIAILFSSIVSSGFNNPLFSQKVIKTYYDSTGVLKEKYAVSGDITEKFHGDYTSYHPNGKIALNGTYNNGLRNGLFTEYYVSGGRKREMQFENGHLNGFVKIFNVDGNLIQSAYFKNDTLSGELKEYYSGGKIKSISEFDHGIPNGVVKEYYENGQIKGGKGILRKRSN